MSDPVYLGDGLYARFNGSRITLLTDDLAAPTDVVCIEWPDVWQRLQTFVNARVKYGAVAAQEDEAIEATKLPALPTLPEDLPPTDPIDVDELNGALRKWGTLLANHQVIWDAGNTGVLKFVNTVPVIELPLKCATCGQISEPFHIRQGAPGWCYVYSQQGQYLADLRNQELVCGECSSKRAAA